ncbi:tRNA-modifying protein YgfZ [Photobacterium lipolyticum]|uniref:tRNA-modifying protein YgfZ n=1 Tax=Photobacterium lipolyticum TaxID=266810 RepID=A0A2T3MXS8_9GAMM|nr:tRNA-modifying protein YgfZ [Photobacterium lipolyticum]PSW04693.1 tRNA-modifying protein YgfZ [Photobacterium lipolyticum]
MSTWSNALNFKKIPLTAQDNLPDLALVNLDDWGLVTLIGDDKKSYLQGQVTCDVVSLPADASTLGAHCDAKGKMRTIFRLFNHNNGYGFLQRKSVMASQLPELKKYAVFSKVDIEASDDVLLGLTGESAQAVVDQLFTGEGDVRVIKAGTAVKIDEDRWLLAVTAEQAETVVNAIVEAYNDVRLSDSTLWDLYDIQYAIPRIDAATELEFIPQAMNLQAVDGISFKKGCYTGQETVARAKYRGINKRAMYIVSGEAAQCPQAGDALERNIGENWRKGGTLIASYQYADNLAVALVVLPNDLDSGTRFRLAAQPEFIWTKQDLPYTLEDE